MNIIFYICFGLILIGQLISIVLIAKISFNLEDLLEGAIEKIEDEQQDHSYHLQKQLETLNSLNFGRPTATPMSSNKLRKIVKKT